MPYYHESHPDATGSFPPSSALGAHGSSVRPSVAPSRTRAATWVPRRIWYVLAYLKRQLTPGTAQALSNARIKEALRWGSEGEVSQIMRWLAGEAPTKGRWSYGVLNTPQVYRFITRERMPSGGYLITLLAVPELLTPPAPKAVQLAFWNDLPMIPPVPRQDAARRGSSTHMAPPRIDPPRQDAADQRSHGDHDKENVKESTNSNMRGRSEKYDWSQVTISGADFIPIRALETAGITPAMLQAADRTIATRVEYNRPAQIRILFQSLLSGQPLYSAAEIAARKAEIEGDARPARTAPDRGAGDHGRDRPGRSDRRENSFRPHPRAKQFSRESYFGCAHD